MLAELYFIIICIITQLHICIITLILKWQIPKNHLLSPLGECIECNGNLCSLSCPRWYTQGQRAALQRDTDKLEEWAQRHRMKLNMDRGKILHLGGNNLWQQYGLGNGEQLFWKGNVVLVDGKLDVIPQCALEAVWDNCTLGYKIAGPYPGSQKKGILGFFNPIQNAASLLRLISIRKADKIDQPKQFQQRSTQTVKRPEHLSC